MKVNMQKILRFSAVKSWTFLAIVLELGVVRITSLPAFDIPRPHPNSSELSEPANFPSHIADDNSFSSSSSSHLDSSSSSLHKIIHLHQPYAQPTRTGAFHLHKIIQKLSLHKDTSKNKNPKAPILPRQATKSGIASTINVKSVNGSFLIKNSNDTAASRLKRQLEGIFHVREAPSTSTVIPILPSEESDSNKPTRKSLFTNPHNRRRVNGLTNVNKSHQRINSTKTTKVETRKEKKFPKAFELDSPSPTDTPHSLVLTHKWKPPLGSSTASPNKSPYTKNANNVTVEIIETSRRTVIKHDGVNNHDNSESPVEISFDDDKLTTTPNGQRVVPSTSLQEESSLLKSTPIFRSIRPRLKNPNKRFRQPGQQANRSLMNESPSPSVPEDSSTFIEDSPTTSPRPRRRSTHNKEVNLPKQIIIEDLTRPPVDVKVSSFQEQIPYNDREVSEDDLKDYLEGHTTFGAKGNFKHTVNRNLTGFIPHHESSSEVKRSHGVFKRTPQPPRSHGNRNSRRNNNNERDGEEDEGVSVSQAEVKKFRGGNGGSPKMTIYTASGVKYAPSTVDEEDLGKKFYEYSGGKSDKNNNRKLKEREERRNEDRDDSSREDNNNSHQFDELYKRGHPAIAKPPQVIYKSHPLGVPYGRVEDEDLYESPLRSDPLSDDVPLKFDPASDVFYGNPQADKDKTLAQSNRPAPVRVENNGDANNEERTSTGHPYRRNRDEISKRIGGEADGGPDENGRYYPPPEEGEGSSSSRGPQTNYGPSLGDDQQYFKDFVSLDDNFQQLPRPSKEDESFSSLIPPEANDYDEDGSRYGYGGDEGEGYDSRGGGRGSSSTSGYEGDERETTDRVRDRERYRKDDEGAGDEREGSRRGNDERREEGRRATSSQRPPRRGNRGQYDEDGYDDFGLNQEGVSPQYFDSSYVDALKHFDDEIKKLEQHERQVVSTENPQSASDGATREPPLIISSPGPAVSYERSNLPRPTESPEPTHYEQREEEGRHGGETSGPPPSENKDGEEEERRGGEEAEEPEEEEEGEEVDEGPSTTAKKEENDGCEEDSEEESQPEKRGVKVVETEEVKRVRQNDKPSNSTTNASAKDTTGNIDDDISGIEKEYGGK